MTTGQIAKHLGSNKNLWADIQAKTGVTIQTMRNIVSEPEKSRSPVTIIALTNYFKKAKIK